MLTQAQVLEAIKNGRKGGCSILDSRDYLRLAEFFPDEDLDTLGFTKAEGVDRYPLPEWTEDNILKHLASDLDFAFEKALNRRGISSSLMYEVIKMWMWVLEDDLQNFEDYPMYGLPLYKAVAVKYDLPNEIGDDEGNEDKYNEDEYNES
jgi:hypothetical protein